MSEINAVQPFIATGNTIKYSPNNSSVDNAITVPQPKNPEYPGVMRVWNSGATIAFLKQGVGAQTAAATDIPLPPTTLVTIRFAADTTHVAVYTTGSEDVYVTPGVGGLSP